MSDSITWPIPTPTKNPYYYPASINKILKDQTPVDNNISSRLMESFTLTAYQQQSSYVQSQDPSEMQGLMQLLSCTDMNMS